MARNITHDTTHRTLIIGRSGSGKTTLAKLLSWEPRTIILDPMNLDWRGPRRYKQPKPHDLDGDGFRWVVSPDPALPESFDGVCESWLEAAYGAGNVFLALDEVDSMWPAFRPAHLSFLARTVKYGRNRGLSWLATTRRPAEVHRDVTAALTRIISFNTSEPRDLEYIRAYAGAWAAARVPGLAKFQYVSLDLYSGTHYLGTT